MVLTFSATAPQFLPEHERKERLELTEEEKTSIERDLYDDIAGDWPEETEEMIQHGTELLQDALNAIPERLKRAYLEACEKCPDLVQDESDPVAFLRCEKFDAEAAATRLVEYWNHRRSFFGPIKAFEPMRMANGALSDEDLETLHLGNMMILPESMTGRAVIFFNGAPAQDCSRESVLRVWFYLLHVLCQCESVQHEGFIVINSILGFDPNKHFDRSLAKKSMTMVRTAMPAQLAVSHAVVGGTLPALKMVAPVSKQLAGKHIRVRAITHSGTEPEMLASLQEYNGLTVSGLSHFVGGGFTHADFMDWVNEQVVEEEKIASSN